MQYELLRQAVIGPVEKVPGLSSRSAWEVRPSHWMKYVFLRSAGSEYGALTGSTERAPEDTQGFGAIGEEMLLLLRAFEVVGRCLGRFVGYPAGYTPLFVRANEVASSQRWLAFDGTDPIEVVIAVEKETRTKIEGCPWWEFPIVELGQAVVLAKNGYHPLDHRRLIAECIASANAGARGVSAAGSLVERIMRTVLGIPAEQIGYERELGEILSYGIAARCAGAVEWRIWSIAEILGAGVASNKSARTYFGILTAAIGRGESFVTVATSLEAN